jgi:hypothetical protein
LQESPGVVFLHASEENHTCRQCAKPYDANERDANGDGSEMGWLRERWLRCLVLSDVCARRGGCAIASTRIVVGDRNAAAAAARTLSIVVVIEFTKPIVVCIVNNNNNNIDSKQSIDHDKHYIDTDEYCIDNDIRFTKLVDK